jgi:hypothetical protein
VLPEALTALAAAGGGAVVQAAGTDAWSAFRQRVAQLLSRGDSGNEHAELERLDQTAAALEEAGAGDTELVRVRQEAVWQTRFEALLESLDGQEREQAAERLQALLAQPGTGAVTAGAGGVAAGGSVHISAQDASIAAGVIQGGAHLANPPQPASFQG